MRLSKNSTYFLTLLCHAIVTTLLNSCAGLSSIYTDNFPLTSQTVRSATTGLILQIPQGWRKVVNNDKGFTDLWLVNEDNTESILLTPMNSEIFTDSRVKSNFTVVKELYLSYLKAATPGGIKLVREELFEIGQNRFEAVEYEYSGKFKRDVIFKSGNEYFILTAYTSSGSGKEQLFSIQNTILQNITSSN